MAKKKKELRVDEIKNSNIYYGKKPLYIERAILRSEAYLTLKKTKSIPIYFHFRTRMKMEHTGKGKQKKWVCTNNGKIVFPYSDAKKLGCSTKQFFDAKKELIEHGFIDVNNDGGIYDGDASTYIISERWRKFGANDFEFKTLLKDKREGRGFTAARKKYGNYGFRCIQTGHPYGKYIREAAQKGELFIKLRDPKKKKTKTRNR
jgi:hypothetical protein